MRALNIVVLGAAYGLLPAMRSLSAGHNVTGFDPAGFDCDGVAHASSSAATVSGADVVITMLPNGAILSSVMDEIVPAARAGACLVDCSTVDVAASKAAHDKAAAAGLLSVDAPVSGGVGGAQAGTLTFMCGGSDESFAVARPLFEIMGQKAVHCGAGGMGQAAMGPFYCPADQKAYIDSNALRIPGQTVSLGRVTFGPKLSWGHTTPDGTSVALHWAAKGLWDFDTADLVNLETGLAAAGTTDLRARTEAGITVRTSNGVTLGFEGFYDGIGASNYDAYGGSAKVAIPLN